MASAPCLPSGLFFLEVFSQVQHALFSALRVSVCRLRGFIDLIVPIDAIKSFFIEMTKMRRKNWPNVANGQKVNPEAKPGKRSPHGQNVAFTVEVGQDKPKSCSRSPKLSDLESVGPTASKHRRFQCRKCLKRSFHARQCRF